MKKKNKLTPLEVPAARGITKKFSSGFIFRKLLTGLTCKTGLKKNIIKKEVFDREIALCKILSKEKRGKCGWGKCRDCGVIPLLYKLHKGQLLEDPVKITKIKIKIFR